ncbi:MAG: hypothetical protein EON60_04480 [Alphaproteobacteria bacterium]|nr:MAG: hypothetical protein EON60_04480 [Alphaproteobacteria bacterium]
MRTILIAAILILMLAGLAYFGTTMQPMLKQIGTVAEFRAQAAIILFIVLATSLLLAAHRFVPARA